MAVDAGRAIRIHSARNSGQRQGEIGIPNAQRAIPFQKNAFWLQKWSERLPKDYADRASSIFVDVRASIY